VADDVSWETPHHAQLELSSFDASAARAAPDNKNPTGTVRAARAPCCRAICACPRFGTNTTCGHRHPPAARRAARSAGTPGRLRDQRDHAQRIGATGFILFQLSGTDLAGSDPMMVHVFSATRTNPNCEAEVCSA